MLLILIFINIKKLIKLKNITEIGVVFQDFQVLPVLCIR